MIAPLKVSSNHSATSFLTAQAIRRGRPEKPVPAENSVRINQYPCGALIADLVDALMHFPCWQAHRSLKETNHSFALAVGSTRIVPQLREVRGQGEHLLSLLGAHRELICLALALIIQLSLGECP